MEYGAFPIETCPVRVNDEARCGSELRLHAYRVLVGDDFGDYFSLRVAFPCGHTLDEIEDTLIHEAAFDD